MTEGEEPGASQDELPQSTGVHPFNRSILRGTSGFWAETDLPVVSWEVPSERRLVPDDIVLIMGAISPVVRVDAATLRKQERKHHDSHDLWKAFDRVIRGWEWWRKQAPHEARHNAYERWRFVQAIADDQAEISWPLLTVLEKQPDGSIKVITSHRRRDSFWRVVMNGNGYHRRDQE